MNQRFGINVLGRVDGMSVLDHIDMIADGVIFTVRAQGDAEERTASPPTAIFSCAS